MPALFRSRPVAAGIAVLAAVTASAGVAFTASAPANASTPRAAQIHGWITANASGITDSTGQSVRLLGVAEGGMNRCSASAPTDREAASMARMGFNSVRLAFSWAAAEPTPPTLAADGTWVHHYDQSYLAKIDRGVAAFRAHGIAVILDMHQVHMSGALSHSPCPESLPGWLFTGYTHGSQAVCSFFTNTPDPAAVSEKPWDAAAAMWKTLAQRYATNNSVIGADLYNEPYVTPQCKDDLHDNLTNFYGTLGSAVRSVNSHIALIMEDGAYHTYLKWGMQLGALPAGLSNIIYSWHFYPTSLAEGMPGLEAHVAKAQQLGAPLWIGEFDGFGAANNLSQRVDPNWQSDLTQMLSYSRSHNVNWDLWEFRGNGDSLVNHHTGAPKVQLVQTLQGGF